MATKLSRKYHIWLPILDEERSEESLKYYPDRTSLKFHLLPKEVYDHKKYPQCPKCFRRFVGNQCLYCEFIKQNKYK